MTLAEINAAVLAGQRVCWTNTRYVVVTDRYGQWFIAYDNGSSIGLTWRDGATLNGDQSEFFIADRDDS